MTSPADLARGALAARLDANASAPVAVAFSGGGDSLAVLLAAKVWADEVGRRLIVFTVDHRLHPRSDAWTRWCADRVARLGVEHRVLTWSGDRPSAGLANAARLARHGLIAAAAREAGARVILFGHTADDALETKAMRADGVGVSQPLGWAPSPVWPQGRGLFILRPLFEARRQAIRDWLVSRGETWIEDPANSDMRQPRARARARLAGGGSPIDRPTPPRPPAIAIRFGPAGDVIVAAKGVGADGDLTNLLGIALVCASGGDRPPRRAALERLVIRLASARSVRATLGGARIVRDGETIHVTRETRDVRGRACAEIALPVDEDVVWDGRFEVVACAPGLTLAALAGRAGRLDHALRRRVAAFAPAARGAAPAIIDASGTVACPTIVKDPRLRIRNLIPRRMAGACGLVEHERQIDLLS